MKKNFLISALALGAVLCAASPAALAQAEPGLTDKTIKIGMFSPMSGASMNYGFDVINAAKMYYIPVPADLQLPSAGEPAVGPRGADNLVGA